MSHQKDNNETVETVETAVMSEIDSIIASTQRELETATMTQLYGWRMLLEQEQAIVTKRATEVSKGLGNVGNEIAVRSARNNQTRVEEVIQAACDKKIALLSKEMRQRTNQFDSKITELTGEFSSLSRQVPEKIKTSSESNTKRSLRALEIVVDGWKAQVELDLNKWKNQIETLIQTSVEASRAQVELDIGKWRTQIKDIIHDATVHISHNKEIRPQQPQPVAETISPDNGAA